MKKVLWGIMVSALLLTLLISGISCAKTAEVAGDNATRTPVILYPLVTPTPSPVSRTTATPVREAYWDNWHFVVSKVSWASGTVSLSLTITNLDNARRDFGTVSLLEPGPDLETIDSTGYGAEPQTRAPDLSKGELSVPPPYTHEFWPNESYTCALTFVMSPYSSDVWLCAVQYYNVAAKLIPLGP